MSRYIFDDNREDRELARLQLIEVAFDTNTVALLEMTGIGTGWACVELGAGAGSIVKWMGARVGPSGSVVAIDKATSYLHRFSSAPYHVIKDDFLNVSLGAKADLLHARYVLIHNAQSETMLRKIRDVVKQGGYVVLEEPDFTSATLQNSAGEAAPRRVNDAICHMFLKAGLDPGYGLELPRKMAEAGFDILRTSSTMHLCQGLTPVANLMAESALALREKYTGTGMASDQDVDRYVTCARDPQYWALYYSTISLIAQVR
jgi:hypothetical protein